jgi:hypothetical protein
MLAARESSPRGSAFDTMAAPDLDADGNGSRI